MTEMWKRNQILACRDDQEIIKIRRILKNDRERYLKISSLFFFEK